MKNKRQEKPRVIPQSPIAYMKTSDRFGGQKVDVVYKGEESKFGGTRGG